MHTADGLGSAPRMVDNGVAQNPRSQLYPGGCSTPVELCVSAQNLRIRQSSSSAIMVQLEIDTEEQPQLAVWLSRKCAQAIMCRGGPRSRGYTTSQDGATHMNESEQEARLWLQVVCFTTGVGAVPEPGYVVRILKLAPELVNQLLCSSGHSGPGATASVC